MGELVAHRAAIRASAALAHDVAEREAADRAEYEARMDKLYPNAGA
jgi:hypothetical protein